MIKARDHKVIGILAEIARDLTPVKSARIAAAIYIRNKPIAFGVNQAKTSPLQAKFARNDKCGALIHAEIDCIKNALKKISVDDLMNSTLYVARMKYTNSDIDCEDMQYGISKPCEGCQGAIAAFNIGRVVYTTDEGTLEEFND